MDTQRPSYVGHDVIDEQRSTIGKVTDVLFDPMSDHPKWLVVNPGILQAERLVPVQGSYDTVAGDIVVPFDRKWVKGAPKAGDHVLTGDIEARAAQHYDLSIS